MLGGLRAVNEDQIVLIFDTRRACSLPHSKLRHFSIEFTERNVLDENLIVNAIHESIRNQDSIGVIMETKRLFLSHFVHTDVLEARWAQDWLK